MSDLPATLTYFGTMSRIGQVLNRSAIPVFEAHELNDPFLPDRFSEMPFDVKSLFESGVKEVSHMILGKSPPKGQPNHPLLKAIMRWRMENRFNDEIEIKEALQGLLPAMVEKTFNEAKQAHQSWIDYVSNKKVALFYEKFQELSMWQALAAQHKGAAIKFKCVEESIFEMCHPADYSKQPAGTVSGHDYIQHMVGTKAEVELNPESILLRQDYALRQMKEWRMVVDCNEQKEQWIEFPMDLIQSIYLGALVPEKTIEQLKTHLKRLNPQINLYKAVCMKTEFGLSFEKLNASDLEAEPE